jgi:hypothetical protein
MSYHPYLFGTWVPVVTLVGGAGNVVPVYTTNLGTYTRIGNQVFFTIHLEGDGGAEGAGTGQIFITLPFTAAASQLAIGGPTGEAINGGNEHLLFVHFTPSTNTVAIETDNVTGSDLEHVVMTGADQNNVTRSIHVQGNFVVQ